MRPNPIYSEDSSERQKHNGSIQYDGLGSTVAITDVNGAVVNKYAYDDFGNVAMNSVETIANPFKYVGTYGVQTDASDLLYMRARYYKPSIGRFINKDPIGLAGGLNQYSYTGDNPINFIDPTGLKTVVDLVRDLVGRRIWNQYLAGKLLITVKGEVIGKWWPFHPDGLKFPLDHCLAPDDEEWELGAHMFLFPRRFKGEDKFWKWDVTIDIWYVKRKRM